MKHIRTLSKQPQAAQTLLGIKFELLGSAIPSVVQMWHNKHNGGSIPF
jgi:hypothetical protein